MFKSKARTRNRYGQEEDGVIENLDRKRVLEPFIDDLREALGKDPKTLKKLAGEVRLRYIVTQYIGAMEADDLGQAELWGKKIEEYCMSKPKEAAVEPSTGFEKLAEVVAEQLSRMGDVRVKELGDGTG